MLRRNTIVAELEHRYSLAEASLAEAARSERRSRTHSLAEENNSDSRSDSFVPMEMDLTTHGPPPEDLISLSKEPLTLKEKCSMYAKLILPHVGLVVLLACYTMIGAIVFHFLELPNEMKMREQELSTIFGIRNNLLDTLWDLSNDNTTDISKQDFKRAAELYFDELATAMYTSYRHQFITDAELRNESHAKMWTFANSIFFATTVITTIGYGNLAPITTYGRIFCIVFGLFGIPLLLVTIADIGKFLSEFLSFLYRSYRAFKRNLRRTSRKLSFRYRSRSRSSSGGSAKSGKMATLTAEHLREDNSDVSSEDELRIPVIMVGLVLVAYMAVGGVLFKNWEKWPYFDAFYFCFITMATIGFGDIVPTEQMYMFFTMAYIVFGLALATMCIDLAGTEYIRKIHYLGQKMETAKTVVGRSLVSGVHQGQHLLRDRGVGLIRTAGGRLIHLSAHEAREYGIPDYILDEDHNILYEPLAAHVERAALKAKIKVMPDQISNAEGYILRNPTPDRMPPQRPHFQSPNAIHRKLVPKTLKRKPGDEPVILVAPFVMKESNI